MCAHVVQVSQLDYLGHVVQLLGQLSSSELMRLLKLKPSGVEDPAQAQQRVSVCAVAQPPELLALGAPCSESESG